MGAGAARAFLICFMPNSNRYAICLTTRSLGRGGGEHCPCRSDCCQWANHTLLLLLLHLFCQNMAPRTFFLACPPQPAPGQAHVVLPIIAIAEPRAGGAGVGGGLRTHDKACCSRLRPFLTSHPSQQYRDGAMFRFCFRGQAAFTRIMILSYGRCY